MEKGMRIGGIQPIGGGAPGFGGAPQAAVDAATDMKAQMNDIWEANRQMINLPPNEKAPYIARINQDLANIARDLSTLNTLNRFKDQLPKDAQYFLKAANNYFQALENVMQQPNPDPTGEIMDLQGDADNLADILQRG